MIYVFLAMGKEINNGLEKFSISEAKKSSKPIAAKAKVICRRSDSAGVERSRPQSGEDSQERVMKESHQKQRDECRLQRKETLALLCGVREHLVLRGGRE